MHSYLLKKMHWQQETMVDIQIATIMSAHSCLASDSYIIQYSTITKLLLHIQDRCIPETYFKAKLHRIHLLLMIFIIPTYQATISWPHAVTGKTITSRAHVWREVKLIRFQGSALLPWFWAICASNRSYFTLVESHSYS